MTETTFGDLFTIGGNKMAPPPPPPLVQSTPSKPTGPIKVTWSAKTANAGTIYANIKSGRKDLEDAIEWLYQNNNVPFKPETHVLDRDTRIKSNKQGTGKNGATTWRDFIEGLRQDKVKGRDFSEPQFKNLRKLWSELGWPAITFTKV